MKDSRAGAEPLLEVQELHATYGPSEVLHGIDFVVPEHHVVAILGANGAGKTTTLRALSGQVSTRGVVRFGGEDLVGKAPEVVARRRIAHVPQGRGTFVNFTVAENLQLGAHLRSDRAGVDADLARNYELFPVLAERREQPAGSLSGGEQQMLAIARALMLRPRLLLLDEPSLGLAPMLTREVFASIETLNREQGTAIVIVEQNARLALELADTAYVLEAGRIVLSGPADDVHDDEGIARAYLGYAV